MNEEVKKTIEELKGVVLSYHRTAGVLDDIIGQIEREVDNSSGRRYMELYMKHQLQYLNDCRIHRGLVNLDIKERALWDKLIEEFKKEG